MDETVQHLLIHETPFFDVSGINAPTMEHAQSIPPAQPAGLNEAQVEAIVGG